MPVRAGARDPGEPTGPAEPEDRPGGHGFQVTLDNFTGPFDVLLGLIAKHRLDITEVALATVTDEFIAYIRRVQSEGSEWSLDEASEFLVIAATLLDLKTARLLPSGEVESEEDVALLEARDLLFARLLQYRAFKTVAGMIGDRLAREGARFPRAVSLEPRFAALLPELVWRITPQEFADLARRALEPREPVPTTVGLEHLHAPLVSVREQAQVLCDKLTGLGPRTFRQLVEDAANTMVVVVRFLALLELFRDALVAFDQDGPLQDLTVRWTGPEEGGAPVDITDDYGPAEDQKEDHAAR